MKALVIFLICGLLTAGLAQQSLKTFNSPDGLFRFQYSPVLISCAPTQAPGSPATSNASRTDQPAGASISSACVSQGAICDGPGSEGTTLACLAYPKERFKDKPLLVAASFFVSEIESAKTEKSCLEGSGDWFVIAKNGPTTFNHIAFEEFEIGDNWAGGGQSGPAYRTFHNNKCYELDIQTVISRAAYDPQTDKPITAHDRSDVERPLRQALRSFAFRK
jgi:hypothetical protein